MDVSDIPYVATLPGHTNTGEKYISIIPQEFYLVRVPGPGRPHAHFRRFTDALEWRDIMLRRPYHNRGVLAKALGYLA
jgi:hypothetical protein